jgi:hypothetical protein
MTDSNKQSESRYSINRFDEYVEKYQKDKKNLYKTINSRGYITTGIALGGLTGIALLNGFVAVASKEGLRAAYTGKGNLIAGAIFNTVLGGACALLGVFISDFFVKDKMIDKKKKKLKKLMSFAYQFDEKNKLYGLNSLVHKLS